MDRGKHHQPAAYGIFIRRKEQNWMNTRNTIFSDDDRKNLRETANLSVQVV